MSKLAFIGAGAMGGALAWACLKSGALLPEELLLSHARPAWAERFELAGARLFADNAELLAEAPDVVVLAVKPQVLPAVVADLQEKLADKLVISIAAGIKLSTLSSLLPKSRLVRAMPNLPVEISRGAVAFALSESVRADDKALIQRLFSKAGALSFMREDQLEVEAAAVGCLPAFVGLFVDDLVRASVEKGVAATDARRLILSTVAGSSLQMLESELHPRAYMESVTSPGGTTAAALRALEVPMFDGLGAALEAALERTRELAKE